MINRYILICIALCHVSSFLCITKSDFPDMVQENYGNNIPLILIPFDVSMQREKYRWVIERSNTQQEIGVPGSWLYDFFKRQWEQLSYDALSDCATLRIPKIIHQIWFGDGVPAELKSFQELWQSVHPEWEYHLWTQDNIDRLPLINRTFIDAAQNPAEKSDLLRLELLYIYGGVYIDMDFEPLNRIDFLNYCYDFYIGIDPLDCGMVQLGSGIIGTIPKHPIIKAALEGIPANYDNPALTGSITRTTGPVHLTQQFILNAGTNGLRDCALPASYIYPLGATEDYYAPEQWKAKGGLCVHHWAKTWNKPEYRRARFRQVKSWGKLL